jgi:uncharacterized membrane protein YagU involved in acid resistance
MNWKDWLLWGFIATSALATLLAGSQALGLTRINIPFLLGSMFTADRRRAKLYGFLVHLVDGWGVALLYILIFESLRQASWWLGGLLGLAQAAFVLMVLMPLMPSFHPHMASEQHGPAANRDLEPPGFMALHYGIQTPVSVFAAHAIFGIILGAFYHLHSR